MPTSTLYYILEQQLNKKEINMVVVCSTSGMTVDKDIGRGAAAAELQLKINSMFLCNKEQLSAMTTTS
jgi:hypothetical protein